MTTITKLEIDSTERKTDHMGVIVINRRMNAVGDIEFILDNMDGTYDDLIDPEHDSIDLDIDSVQFFYGHVYEAEEIAEDGDGMYQKFVKVSGRDQAEELLFHDGFEYQWTDTATDIETVLDDIFNNLGLTWYHIVYVKPLTSVAVGAVEKSEGQSLLSFLQELHRNAGYCFYVSDIKSGESVKGEFVSKALASLNSTGLTLTKADLLTRASYRRRSANKLYNYIKLTGKNPQFDVYTEQTASSWAAHSSSTITDEATIIKVGNYSIKVAAGITSYGAELQFDGGGGLFNYTSLDLSKGIIGCWIFYDDGDDGKKWRFDLEDSNSHNVFYVGNKTKMYKNYWGWIEATLGTNIDSTTGDDKWVGDYDFLWEDVEKVRVQIGESCVDYPDEFYIDGLTLPVPPIAIASEGSFSDTNPKRELILSRPEFTTQNALQKLADKLLVNHQDGLINEVKLTVEGDTSLKHAGTTATIDLTNLVSSDTFYINNLVHTIAPRIDILKGHDFVTAVEAVKVGSVAWDLTRLSPAAVGQYSNVGIGMKRK